MDPLYTLFTGFSITAGAILGSFWNVAIARWPERRSVVQPRSACPSCSTPIAAYDNIPIVSWLVLRARCRTCGWSIPARYPLTELLGGLIGFLIFRRFVPDATALDLQHGAAAVVYFGFASALVIATFADIRHRIIPDEVSIYAIPAAIASCGALEWLGYTGWMSLGLKGSFLGAALGLTFFGTAAALTQILTGREGLGWGDVKMLGMIGAFLGAHPAILVVTMGSSLTGATIGIAMLLYLQRRPYLPFGPNLALWSAIYLLYGDVLLPRFFPALSDWFPASFGV